MIRRSPESTRTDTLFPYTTLVRSEGIVQHVVAGGGRRASAKQGFALGAVAQQGELRDHAQVRTGRSLVDAHAELSQRFDQIDMAAIAGRHRLPLGIEPVAQRSNERRGGKECVSTGRTR